MPDEANQPAQKLLNKLISQTVQHDPRTGMVVWTSLTGILLVGIRCMVVVFLRILVRKRKQLANDVKNEKIHESCKWRTNSKTSFHTLNELSEFRGISRFDSPEGEELKVVAEMYKTDGRCIPQAWIETKELIACVKMKKNCIYSMVKRNYYDVFKLLDEKKNQY